MTQIYQNGKKLASTKKIADTKEKYNNTKLQRQGQLVNLKAYINANRLGTEIANAKKRNIEMHTGSPLPPGEYDLDMTPAKMVENRNGIAKHHEQIMKRIEKHNEIHKQWEEVQKAIEEDKKRNKKQGEE